MQRLLLGLVAVARAALIYGEGGRLATEPLRWPFAGRRASLGHARTYVTPGVPAAVAGGRNVG